MPPHSCGQVCRCNAMTWHGMHLRLRLYVQYEHSISLFLQADHPQIGIGALGHLDLLHYYSYGDCITRYKHTLGQRRVGGSSVIVIVQLQRIMHPHSTYIQLTMLDCTALTLPHIPYRRSINQAHSPLAQLGRPLVNPPLIDMHAVPDIDLPSTTTLNYA